MLFRPTLKFLLFAGLVFASSSEVWADAVLSPWQPFFKGIEHAVGTNFPNTVFNGSTGPYTNTALQVMHCLRIDLTDPDVQLLPSPPAPNPVFDSRETLTYAIGTFIRSNRVQVAANAQFYNANPGGSDPSAERVSCDIFGLSISRGVTVSPVGESRYATLLFSTNNQPIAAFDNRPPGISTAGIFTAVTGFYPIVSNGISFAAAAAISYPDSTIHGPQPRMIYGLSQDRRRLFLMSIDGRQSGYSDGAKDEESAWWSLQVGMWDAINMDGGGSAALYTTDTNGVPVALNHSSYLAMSGRERYIGSHLGVYASPISTFITGLSVQPAYTNAVISWATVSNATTQIEYGLTTAYGSSTTLDPTLTTNHVVSLTGLIPGTNYYFRAISTIGANAFVSASSFRTLDFVGNVAAQPGLTDATITWDTPWASTSQVEYGLTLSYGSASSLDMDPVTNHLVTLTGLQPGITYYFRVISQTGSSSYASAGVFTTSNYPPVLAFDVTNTWRYATGNLDGISWQAKAYNDSAWPSGRGFLWADNRGPNSSIPLEATSMPLNPATGNPFITYYFRTHFQLAGSPAGATLILSNYLDDGAVFYLNGVEIYRAFMPAAPAVITSSTLSSGYNCASGNATCPLTFTVAGDLITNFLSGDNVLAVEVHNYRVDSPDVTFGAGLLYTAVPGGNAPPVLAPIGNKSINEGAPLSFVASANDPDSPPQKLTYALDPGAPAAASINPTNGAFAWTPTEADGPGVYSVTVRVTDNGSPPQSDSETISITVNEINSAPTLNPIADQTMAELATLSVTNVASDADIPAQTLTFALVSGPSGMNVNGSSGVLTWTPTEAQGPSTNAIVVRVFDNGTPSLSATQSFKLFVNEVNSLPTLNPIADQTMAELATLNVTNVASDPDIPAQTLTFALVNGPSGLGLDGATGVLTWTPNESQGPSTNTVVVRVFDSGTPSLSATQSFKVIVNEVNSLPTLNPIADQTMAELATLNVTNVANDADVPAQTLTFALVNGPSGVSLNAATGVLNWTPTEAQGPSTNTVVVRVFDSGTPSLSATQSFKVIVNEVNSLPTLNPIADQTMAELATLNVTNVANDADVPAQTLTFALVNGPSGVNLDAVTGVLSWTPTEAQGPSTNTVVVRVFDNGTPSLSATQSFKVIVNEVNTAPTFNPIVDQSVLELATLSVTNVATDADSPAQTLTFALVSAPTGASLNGNVLTWTPTQAQGPSTNTVVVRVFDSGTPSMSATQTFKVFVSEVNTPPTLNPIADQTVAELATLNVTNVASDSDIPAQTLTFALVNGPSGVNLNAATGVLNWTPNEAQGPSTNTIVVRVFDNSTPSLSATQSFKVFVNEVNSSPTLNPIADQTVTELATLNVTNVATDADIPAQALTFALVSGPTGASVNASTGLLTWTPTQAQGPSTNTIVVRVFDNGTPSLSATQTFKVFVSEVNTAPTLNPIADQTIAELATLNLTNVASDPDLPAQTLTFALVNGPSGVNLDAATGVLNWTPTEAQGPSTNTIVLRVFDNSTPSLSATQSFKVFVNEVNAAPTFIPIADYTIAELTTLNVTNVASDVDIPVQTLSYELISGPSGATFDNSTGVFTWTPTEAQGPSTNTVIVRVFDDGTPSLSATQTFTVLVNEVNSAPIFHPIDTLTTTEGALLAFTCTATDADLPRQTLRYSLDPGAPSSASIVETNGLFSWQPPAGSAPSTNVVTIRVTDSGAPELSDRIALTIVVVAPPRLAITKSPAGLVTLTWNSIASHAYRVEYSDESTSGPWSQLGEDVVADSTLATTTDPAATLPSRIYRVRLVN